MYIEIIKYPFTVTTVVVYLSKLRSSSHLEMTHCAMSPLLTRDGAREESREDMQEVLYIVSSLHLDR